MNKVQYGLRKKGEEELLYYYHRTNNEAYSIPVSYYLTDKPYEGEGHWLVDDYETALMAKWTSEDWYNADYETPVNPFDPLSLEVVKVLTIYVEKDTKIQDEIAIVNKKLEEQGYAPLDEELVKRAIAEQEE